METKLILKHRGDYDYFLISRTENSESVVASLNPDHVFEQKLSKQNCDEIFGIVDVNNLAYNHRRLYQDSFEGMNECIMKDAMHQEIGFVAGFNKAMELNKDKVFTVEQMREAIKQTRQGMLFLKKYEDEFIQSLQQPTEIQVEIEMEDKIALDGHTVIGVEPKLDSNGCLILKKVA
jgi:hypothetical protein